MLNWINRPWLHFLVLGTGLFLLLRWLDPPPRPVVGPRNPAPGEGQQKQ